MIKHFAHSAVGGIGSKIITLICFIALGRLLSPHDFGIFAIVAIFSDFASIFVEFGTGAAIVYYKNADHVFHSTALWINVIVGLLFSLLLFISSELIAAYFNSSEVIIVAKSISVLFILNGLSVAPIAILQKKKLFDKISKIEILSTSFGFLIAIIIAVCGGGVWSLAFNVLSASALRTYLAFKYTNWSPNIILDKKSFFIIWDYSKFIIFSKTFNYFTKNADKFIIGKYFGPSPLGAYKYGFTIASMPMQFLNTVANRVFFADYAEKINDKDYIKNIHLKSVRLVSFITFPMMIGLSIVSDVLILALLGDKWNQMALYLSYLSISFLLGTVAILNQPLYLSFGKTKLQFKVTVFCRFNVLLCVVVGAYFGEIIGLLYGLIIARIINFYPSFYFAGKLVDLSIMDYLKNFYRILFCSLCMAVVVYFIKSFKLLDFSNIIVSIILVLSGIIFYSFFSFIFQSNNCREFISIFNSSLNRK